MTSLDANKKPTSTTKISTLDQHHEMVKCHIYSACNFHLRATVFKLGSKFHIPDYSHAEISSASLGNRASLKYLIFILTPSSKLSSVSCSRPNPGKRIYTGKQFYEEPEERFKMVVLRGYEQHPDISIFME